MRILLRKFK